MRNLAILILPLVLVAPMSCTNREKSSPTSPNPMPVGAAFKKTSASSASDKDKEKLQGKWTGRLEIFGRTIDELETRVLGISGNVISLNQDITIENQKFELTYGTPIEWHFSLDPAQQPRAIDLTVYRGDTKGESIEGIYDVDGDSLRLCVDLGQRRPTEFITKPDSTLVLFVLKRDPSD